MWTIFFMVSQGCSTLTLTDETYPPVDYTKTLFSNKRFINPVDWEISTSSSYRKMEKCPS